MLRQRRGFNRECVSVSRDQAQFDVTVGITADHPRGPASRLGDDGVRPRLDGGSDALLDPLRQASLRCSTYVATDIERLCYGFLF